MTFALCLVRWSNAVANPRRSDVFRRKTAEFHPSRMGQLWSFRERRHATQDSFKNEVGGILQVAADVGRTMPRSTTPPRRLQVPPCPLAVGFLIDCGPSTPLTSTGCNSG